MTWIVGTNMPGYLPDSAPSQHKTFEGAKACLIEEVEHDIDYHHADYEDGDLEAADIIDALEEVKTYLEGLKAPQEVSCTAFNRAYWITQS
jgi:hypothetical protein